MRFLVVEDDLISRTVLSEYLAPYGKVDIAVDGEAGILTFEQALQESSPYHLVCLDIMMPKMDGQEVLRRIRRMEEERGMSGANGTKVVMTTALDDYKNIMDAFREQCEAYLVKPIEKGKLIEQLKAMGLVSA